MFHDSIDRPGQQMAETLLQRASGQAGVSVALSRGVTRLIDLHGTGSARVILPRTSADRPEAVFLNTSGGLTAGDRLGYDMTLGPDARLLATTQTAERAYLAPGGPARVEVRASLGAGAVLHWLPQETILFQGANLQRDTRIDLAPGASCLLAETVVLGRRAMGEMVTRAHVSDRRRVFQEGRPLWHDHVALSPQSLSRSAGPAVLSGHPVFATLALCGPGAEAAAPSLRALAPPPGLRVAVSGWAGRTILRATAPDLWPMQGFLTRAIIQLTGQPLPRVWQMKGARA